MGTAPMESDFRWVDDGVGPDATTLAHVDGIEVLRLMFDSTLAYLRKALAAAGTDFDSLTSGRPIVRDIAGRFVSELHRSEAIRIGVRVASRSTRSFVLEQAIWRVGGSLVATGTVALVTIDTEGGGAVPIPHAIWRAIEAIEGHAITQSG